MANNPRDPLPGPRPDPASALAAIRVAAWAGAGVASLILAAAALTAPAPRRADIGVTGTASPETGSGYALALGELRSLEAVQSRWADLSNRYARLGSLTPLVLARRAVNGQAYMLLAGPLPNAGAAAEACRALRAGGIVCEATLFAGEPLMSN